MKKFLGVALYRTQFREASVKDITNIHYPGSIIKESWSQSNKSFKPSSLGSQDGILVAPAESQIPTMSPHKSERIKLVIVVTLTP